MKTAYFDCFSGVSGDMILASLLDAGLDFNYLERGLKKLRLSGYSLKRLKVNKNGFAATKFTVSFKPAPRRSLKEIEGLIRKSGLSRAVKSLSLKIFENLAKAEQSAHGKSRAHFHEIGDTDSLIDIVGAAIALDYLGIGEIYASSINTGSGTVKTAHGILPVPAPATSFLLKDAPVYSSGEPYELTTPTGAAILKTVCKGFGRMPLMKIARIGCGAGSFNLKDRPDILRVFIGSNDEPVDYETDTVSVIETNIDDMNLVGTGHVLEKIFEAGALDVFYEPVYMKKSRLGIKLTALAEKRSLPQVVQAIFEQTPTFGVRTYEAQRYKLRKVIKTVKTKYGRCRVKIGIQASPEYEDCKALSAKTGAPFWKIYDEVKEKA